MRIRWFLLTLVVIVVDQITKYWVTNHLQLWDSITLIPGFFDITLRHNTGAAYSLLATASGWQRWFFIGLGLVISSIIVVWMFKLSTREKLEGIALSLILGGAVGNLIDRGLYGYVIDFILWHYHEHEFPAFNIADSAISLGVFLFILTLFKSKKLSAG